ncbi:carotenoid oxygenase family protein [Roseixanthobacter pseudopolyaromaticivorans]|uniref:carotenoid oxygenase family protein n=1 Tax=Xanthobacteraceae TaxID=335928 RepID=UPI00372BEF6D
MWSSDNPYLQGAFAPVSREIEQSDLEVVSGAIPAELSGVYMRNGPNPRYEPISYAYPFDGDGMIHAVYFDNGRARYKNRFVRTRALAVEHRAGRAVYGGVFHPVPVDPALVGPDGDPGPFKNGAYINVLRHGDHLLALGEAAPAYEMTMELETVGEWQAGGDRPLELGAHNRHHPVTGDMFAISYSIDEPVVTVHHIDRAGVRVRSFPVQLAAPAMIHDFILTEHHIVLLVGPAIFDLAAAAEGNPFLQWRPELGTRICVMPLSGETPVWLDAPAFFVFHFANGFERGSQIVVDYVRHSRLALGYKGNDSAPPALRRIVLDLSSRQVREDAFTCPLVEFPRINDRLEARASRYVYVPTVSESLDASHRRRATFNCLQKVDMETARTDRHDFGDRLIGEPVFIPRAEGTGEDNGYIATFLHDTIDETSQFVLLDARRIDEAPVAVIRLPQRVPQGLHGTWISK